MESEAACTQFEELVRTPIFRIGEFDSTILHNQAEDCIFKLVRYPRFGPDRSPFNPSLRAHTSVQGKRPVPVGYYLMIRPGGQSFLRGGLSTNMYQGCDCYDPGLYCRAWRRVWRNHSFS